MNGTFVLENKKGQVARVLNWEANSASIVYLADTGRITAVNDVKDLTDNEIKFTVLAEVTKDQIKKSPMKIAQVGYLKFISSVEVLTPSEELKEENDKDFIAALKWTTGSGLAVLVLTLLIGHFFKPQVEEQQVVQIMPREKVVEKHVVAPKIQKPQPQQTVAQKVHKKTVKSPIVQTKVVKTPSKTHETSLNNVGALAILGSLKNSRNQGGLQLNAVNTTRGPGLGGTAGSGGMQTTNYGKGLIAVPLGPQGRASGAGGYGKFGAGGGKAGYGKMSLIGSSTAYFEPIQSDAVIEGGLDRAQIEEVIQRHLGQIRYCYEHGLQGQPNLAGRIGIKFLIGGNGYVSSADISNSSLHSNEVESCVVSRLKSWKFPQPRGGVIVKVNYPFVLKRVGSQG